MDGGHGNPDAGAATTIGGAAGMIPGAHWGLAAAQGAGYGARIGFLGGAAGLIAGVVVGGAIGLALYHTGASI